MKILHCCLSSFFIDNFNYQENALPRQNKKDGHDVHIIASTEIYRDGRIDYTQEKTYYTEDGILICRVPYRCFLPKILMKKLRMYKGVYKKIENFNPDVIFFHGMSAVELLTIKKYVKHNPDTILYLDNHADIHNSASNWVSRNILHKVIYRYAIKRTLPFIKKVFCLSYETQEFAKEIYAVPEMKLEFYPLGGTILEDKEYIKIRSMIREKLQIGSDDILFTHTGKMGKEKKTIDVLKAFSKVKDDKYRLLIIGKLLDDIQDSALKLINSDSRVIFLGWKNGQELEQILCATDVYVQPGTQSATMQNALCARCAVILYPYKSHVPYLSKENGFYVENEEDLINAFRCLSENKGIIDTMSAKSLDIAKKLLDYKKLAARIY